MSRFYVCVFPSAPSSISTRLSLAMLHHSHTLVTGKMEFWKKREREKGGRKKESKKWLRESRFPEKSRVSLINGIKVKYTKKRRDAAAFGGGKKKATEEKLSGICAFLSLSSSSSFPHISLTLSSSIAERKFLSSLFPRLLGMNYESVPLFSSSSPLLLHHESNRRYRNRAWYWAILCRCRFSSFSSGLTSWTH